MKAAMRVTMEVMISHAGTPNGMRTSITIGEVKGIIEHQNTNGELGSFITTIITMKGK